MSVKENFNRGEIMRKLIGIFNIVFLYLVLLFTCILLYNDYTIDKYLWIRLFEKKEAIPLVILCICSIILIAFNIFILKTAWNEKYNNNQILLPLLIMKVVQFPAFLLIICNINILLYYTIGYEIRLIILLITGASFLCAGLFAVVAFRRLEQEKLITKNYQIICSILSFLFLVDVVVVIYSYIKLKRGKSCLRK